MNVLIFAAHYLPGYKGGGPIKTIKNLVDEAGDEINFKILTSDRDFGDSAPYTSVACGAWNKNGKVSVFYAQTGLKGYAQFARELFAKNYDVVYLNSFFSLRFSLFPLVLARILRQRVVLAPRGEFSEGALEIKSLKKKSYIKAYRLLGLHRAIVFQVSTEFEKQDVYRELGSKSDICIAENISSKVFSRSPVIRTPGPLRAVFISRISPKKNLLAALEVLQRVQKPLLYDIYGPIEDQAYWQQCEMLIATLPSHVRVQHIGMLNPDEVVKTLEEYDVFFFPTKGENYGHVIAEALCAGLPILIADTTPWRNLEERGIGWDLPLGDPNAFSTALDKLAVMSAEEHLRMRERVLAWAKIKFSQRDAVESNIALFKYAYEKK